MRVYFQAINTKVVETKFAMMGNNAVNAKPALEKVADYMMEVMAKNFQSQGRRGGGSWKRISPGWRARKVRMGLDPRIGHATLALRKSMTKRDAPEQILSVGRTRVTLGSKLPYAKVQQRNRPYVYTLAEDRAEMVSIIRRHVLSAWRKKTRAAL